MENLPIIREVSILNDKPTLLIALDVVGPFVEPSFKMVSVCTAPSHHGVYSRFINLSYGPDGVSTIKLQNNTNIFNKIKFSIPGMHI